MNTLKRVDEVIVTLTSWVVAYLTLQMALMVLLGVYTRYVLNDSLAWIEELARFSMVWLSWVGGGLAFRSGAHIAVKFTPDALQPNLRAVVVFCCPIAVFF